MDIAKEFPALAEERALRDEALRTCHEAHVNTERDLAHCRRIGNEQREENARLVRTLEEACQQRAGTLVDLAAALAQKDGAYSERNQCVAAMARMALALGLRAGVRRHPAEDASWEDDWRTILFIDLPTGQASWHFHDSERHLLAGLPEYAGAWDGHTTPEKYARVAGAFTGLTP